MAIKPGRLTVAKDVVNQLAKSLRALSNEARNVYSTIFDANNSTVPPVDAIENSLLWKDIKPPENYPELSAAFLSDLSVQMDGLPGMAHIYNIEKDKETCLYGFRDIVMSCYAYASNIRYTLIDYLSNDSLESQKINNMFLSRIAIESKDTSDNALSLDNPFYNKTAVPLASCSYATSFDRYKMNPFSADPINVSGVNYRLIHTVSDNNKIGMFSAFTGDTDSKYSNTDLTSPLLYSGKIMYANDVHKCINYMDTLTRMIRDQLSCRYGKFGTSYINVTYIPYNIGRVSSLTDSGYVGVDLTNDESHTVRIAANKFTLSTLNKVYENSNYTKLTGNCKTLSSSFVGWTTVSAIADIDDPAELSSFWDTSNPALSSINIYDSNLDSQILAFAKEIKEGGLLSVYPVYMTTFPIECYYGWYWGDFTGNNYCGRVYHHSTGDGTGARELFWSWDSGIRPGYKVLKSGVYTYTLASQDPSGGLIDCNLGNFVAHPTDNAYVQCGFFRNCGNIWNYNSYNNTNPKIKNFIGSLRSINESNINGRLSAKFRLLSNSISTYTGDADITLSSYMNAIFGGASWCGYIEDGYKENGTSINGFTKRHNIQSFGADHNIRARWVGFNRRTGKSYVTAQSNYPAAAHPRGQAGDDGCQDSNLCWENDAWGSCPQAGANDITQSWYYFDNVRGDTIPNDFVSNPKHTPTLRFRNGHACFRVKFEVSSGSCEPQVGPKAIKDLWTRNPNVVAFNNVSQNKTSGGDASTGPYFNSSLGLDGNGWQNRRASDIINPVTHNFYPTQKLITQLAPCGGGYDYTLGHYYQAFAYWPEWGCHIEKFKLRFARFGTNYPGTPTPSSTIPT